jgi:hypothetical protein
MLAIAIDRIDRNRKKNPDLFIGDIVPGDRSLIPNLLDLRNQESDRVRSNDRDRRSL